jgi:ATP-dependent exoDNAse (exonuclease V) beta subunit
LFAAPDDERDAAAGIAIKLLTHSRFDAARKAEAAGRRVWREAPVSLRIPSTHSNPQANSSSLRAGDPSDSTVLVDGQVDLAYETDQGWVIVDFKTDIEIASAADAYKQQVALYVEAVKRATGKPATGVLLKV